MLDAILSKLKEPGTINGLSILLGLFGVHLAPELTAYIATAVGAVVGIVEIVKRG